MSAAMLHNPEDVRDSIESLLGAHGTNRPYIYWSLLVVTIAAVVAVPLVKVDLSVGAAGQIRPAVERLSVFPAVGGRIEQLFVDDNQRVHSGEIMLVIDSSALKARIEQNRSETEQNERALQDLASLLAPSGWASRLARSSKEEALVAVSTGAVPAPPPNLASPHYYRQHALLQSDLARLKLQQSKAQQDLARAQSLHLRGLITEQDFDQKRYAARATEHETDLAIQQALARWQSDQLERRLKQTILASEQQQLAQQAELYTVRAPINGTAIGFMGLHAGVFVSADQKIGEISPSGNLQADVYISPRDVGFVRPDQDVKLQVDAFPYTEWGMLRGRVRNVSQDFVQVGQQIAFKAVIDLDATALESAAGTRVQLRRGMTVQARFVLQRRSLFNVLFGKMSESLDPRAHGAAD